MRKKSATPRISLVMIARNEQEFLADCLESVKGVVDEIVVADTGSSDRTPEIVREFGGKVVEFPWVDDFSAARNASLRAATADYALYLDADERLASTTSRLVRQAAARKSQDYLHLRLRNVYQGREVGAEVRSLRMFRLGTGVEFAGRIHEQPVLHGLRRGGRCDALIHHLGYQPEVFSARGKRERNTRLLELALADTAAGGNPKLRSMYLFYYSLQAEGDERFERLSRFVEYVLANEAAIEGHLPWIPCGMIHYGIDLRNRERNRELERIARWTIGRFGAAPILKALLAHALIRRGEWLEADSQLGSALSPRVKPNSIHEEYNLPPGVDERLARVVLGELRERQQRWAEAEVLYRGVIETTPAARSRLAYVAARCEKFDEALEWIEGDARPIHETGSDLACLAFALSLLTQSTRGLLLWGERVRVLAPGSAVCRSMLEAVENRRIGPVFRPEDFPELEKILPLPKVEVESRP